MKQALVTGAAGFIGQYVVEEFVRQGWRVLALVHRSATDRLRAGEQQGSVTVVRGDVTDPAGLRAALRTGGADRARSLDAVAHCAGRASDVGRRREFRRINFESVGHLVRLAREQPAACFVFVSTTDVYGLRDFSGQEEDELPLSAHPPNPYPRYKIAAERTVRDQLPGSRFAIVRPAQVWGVGDRTLTPRLVAFLRRSPWIVHFGRRRGGNRWPLAHVRNVAAAVFLAATDASAAGTAINVVDSEWTTVDEFYRMIAGVYFPARKFGTLNLPFGVGLVWGWLVSLISDACNLRHPVADPSLYALYAVSRNLDFGNRRFRELMARAGRTPVSREEGLRELRAARDPTPERSTMRGRQPHP
jgi:nucleoside-diphosphate-sugar epimerase